MATAAHAASRRTLRPKSGGPTSLPGCFESGASEDVLITSVYPVVATMKAASTQPPNTQLTQSFIE